MPGAPQVRRAAAWPRSCRPFKIVRPTTHETISADNEEFEEASRWCSACPSRPGTCSLRSMRTTRGAQCWPFWRTPRVAGQHSLPLVLALLHTHCLEVQYYSTVLYCTELVQYNGWYWYLCRTCPWPVPASTARYLCRSLYSTLTNGPGARMLQGKRVCLAGFHGPAAECARLFEKVKKRPTTYETIPADNEEFQEASVAGACSSIIQYSAEFLTVVLQEHHSAHCGPYIWVLCCGSKWSTVSSCDVGRCSSGSQRGLGLDPTSSPMAASATPNSSLGRSGSLPQDGMGPRSRPRRLPPLRKGPGG